MTADRSHRGTIHVEDGEVLVNERHAEEQHVMRLRAPTIARRARAGSFVHLRCESTMAMRRPMSVMRAEPDEGWIEVLFKVVGAGTRALAQQTPGTRLSMLGPIGVPFWSVPGRDRALLLGGGVGIPPMVFLADELRRSSAVHPALVVMGSEVPFPLATSRSRTPLAGVEADVDATLALLDDWGIPSRLTTTAGYAGCFNGYVTDIARAWLQASEAEARARTVIYACGPTPMLAATARLAAEFGLPAQVSLEEFMACAVGGCAGCAVKIDSNSSIAMKRVCVDGPVFEAATVDWAALPH